MKPSRAWAQWKAEIAGDGLGEEEALAIWPIWKVQLVWVMSKVTEIADFLLKRKFSWTRVELSKTQILISAVAKSQNWQMWRKNFGNDDWRMVQSNHPAVWTEEKREIQLLKLQNKSVPQWDGTWAETFCAKKKTKRGQKYFDYEDLTAGKRWLNPTRREQGKNQSGFSLQVPHLSFSNCIWRQHLNVSTLHATSSEEDEFSLVAAVAGYEEMADRGRRCSFQTLFFN